MQPEVQTTTWGSLAVSMGALEIATVIQGALEVLSLYLYTSMAVTYTGHYIRCHDTYCCSDITTYHWQ